MLLNVSTCTEYHSKYAVTHSANVKAHAANVKANKKVLKRCCDGVNNLVGSCQCWTTKIHLYYVLCF